MMLVRGKKNRIQRVQTSGLALISSVIACAISSSTVPALAYPVFQEFSEKNSGRTVSCAMCHTNESGPTGDAPGQIGRLSEDERKRLQAARAQMEPGGSVDSPILNEFGNSIIKAIGRKKFLETQKNPVELANLLGNKIDLDEDGVPDGQEFLDGTDPTNKHHADPWKLFLVNLDRYKFHVIITAIAIFALDYGFANVLKGMYVLKRRDDAEQ